MRKVLIFFICISFSLAFTAITAYIIYDADVLQDREDYGFGDVIVENGNAYLEVLFYEEAERLYSHYDTMVDNNTLYISIYASYKDKNAQKPDDTGYIRLTLPIADDITEIRYVTKLSTYSIWKKESTSQ